MSQGDISLVKKTKNKKNNRRKKRRTQDISDSSSDSENSSVENEVIANVEQTNEVTEPVLSDIELEKDEELSSETVNHSIPIDAIEKLNNVKLTTTELTGVNGFNLGNIDLKEVSTSLNESSEKLLEGKKDKNGLKNEYLSMLFENYGDDMNQLRNAPDFTSKSLVLLANVLKDGGNMFDLETLKTIVEDK